MIANVRWKKIAPRAFALGVTSPVMRQGAVFEGTPITAGWEPDLQDGVQTGDWVRVDPSRSVIEWVRRQRKN